MEDSSPLRRGRPSTHVVFGFAQTINSADFLFVEALDKVRELKDPKCINIFAGTLDLPDFGSDLIPYYRRTSQPVYRPKL